jgi:hypothetical protein
MAGPFEFPVNTPSTRFFREQDKANEPKPRSSFREALTAPTAPSVSAPSAGGMLAPGIPVPSQEPSGQTPSFREVLMGRTGTRAEAPMPGWGAYLGQEDWQQDRPNLFQGRPGFMNPLSALEVFSYPGIRHAINFTTALAEGQLDTFRETFTQNPLWETAEEREERKLGYVARGRPADASWSEHTKWFTNELFGDESSYVKRMNERGFLESVAVSLLDPTLALSKVRHLTGARIGISDDLYKAARHADWTPIRDAPYGATKTDDLLEYTDFASLQAYEAHLAGQDFISSAPPVPDTEEWVSYIFRKNTNKVDHQGNPIGGRSSSFWNLIDFTIHMPNKDEAGNWIIPRPGATEGSRTFQPFRIPLLAAASVLDPASVARDPIRQIEFYRGAMYGDFIPAALFQATLKARTLGYRQRKGILQNLDYNIPLIEVDDAGRFLGDDIEQARGLGPNNDIMSMQVHDIAENIGHYTFKGDSGIAKQEFLQEVRHVSRQFAALLDNEPGISVKKLKGEADFQYIHRVVNKYKGKLANDYAKAVSDILQNHNWARPIHLNEDGFEYIRRVLNEMALREKESPGFIERLGLGDEWIKSLEDIGELANIDVKGGGRIDKARTVDYVVNGLERAGYEPDIFKELHMQGQIAYRMIVDQRVRQFVSEFAITKNEFLEGIHWLGNRAWNDLSEAERVGLTKEIYERRLERLADFTGKAPGLAGKQEAVNDQLGVYHALRRAIGLARGGAGITTRKTTPRYVLSSDELKDLREINPTLAEHWEMMMSMDVVSGYNVISRLGRETAGFASLRKKDFDNLLLEIRLEKYADDFPSQGDSPGLRERGRRMTTRVKPLLDKRDIKEYREELVARGLTPSQIKKMVAAVREPGTGRFTARPRQVLRGYRDPIHRMTRDARKKLRAAGSNPKAIRSVGMPKDMFEAYMEGVTQIKATIGKGEMTQREVGAVLRRHTKNTNVANRMLRKLYRDEFEGPVTRRRRTGSLSRAETLGQPGEMVFEEAATRRDQMDAMRNTVNREMQLLNEERLALAGQRERALSAGGLLEGHVSPEWGQAVGTPGISGKFVPSQWITQADGTLKLVTGPDLAESITQRFGYSAVSQSSVVMRYALNVLSTVANLYRLFKATFDVGIMFLQLSALLGIDLANLMTGTAAAGKDLLSETMRRGVKKGYIGDNAVLIRGNEIIDTVIESTVGRTTRSIAKRVQPEGPRFTNLFLTSAKHSFWSFFDPEHQLTYWMQPENYRVMAERSRYGSLIQPSSPEMTVGITDLEKILNKAVGFYGDAGANERKRNLLAMGTGDGAAIRGAAVFGRGLVKQTLGRADAAWSAGRNVAGNEMWKAFAPFAEKTGNLPDLARMTNLMTGILSMQNLGHGATKRSLLNAFGFFSPRYTFAQFALIGHMLNPSNTYTSKQARQMMLGMIAANTTFFTLAAMALGQQPRIDPRPKRLGGDGADLWTVDIGGHRVGVGGLLFTPMRIILETGGAAWDDPNSASDIFKPDMTNPIIRAYRGKSAGITSVAWTLISGRDFLGDPVRETPDDVANYLKTVLAPIWSEDLITEGGGAWPTALADFHGLRGYPESKWTSYILMLEEALGKDWKDISEYEKKILQQTMPDIKEAHEAAKADSARRGRNEGATEYFATLEGHRVQRDTELDRVMQGILEGKWTWGLEVRKYLQRVNAEYRVNNESLKNDPRFVDTVADFKKDEPEFPEDKAYQEYWDIWLNPQWDEEDSLGEINFAGRDAELLRWRAKQDDTVIDKVDLRLQYTKQTAPLLLQMYWSAQEALRPYWNVNQTIVADFDAEVQGLWSGFLSADRIQQRKMAQMYPIINHISAMRDHERQGMRLANPRIDLELLRWGYTSTPVSSLGWEFYESLGSGMNPAAPSMPDPSLPLFDTSAYSNVDEAVEKATRE